MIKDTAQTNKHRIAVKIGSFVHNFTFRSGGDLQQGTTKSDFHGGIVTDGADSPDTCSGTILVPSVDLANRLIQAYNTQEGLANFQRNAVHYTEETMKQTITAVSYETCVITGKPHMAIGNFGGACEVTISFSLGYEVDTKVTSRIEG